MFTAPDELRAKLGGLSATQLVNEAAKLRPRPGGDVVVHGVKTTAMILARRVHALDAELATLDEQIGPLVKAAAPELLNIFGVGVDTAAVLLVTAGDNPERITSEAKWAMLCGIAPIPATSGLIDNRFRLNTRRRPTRQQRDLADRDHPPRSTRTTHRCLHATPPRRGQIEASHHPLSQALRRPRNLPGAATLTRTR